MNVDLKARKRELYSLLGSERGGPVAVLEKLEKLLPENSPRQEDVTLLFRRINDANLKRLRRTLSDEKLQLEYNQISEAISNLIKSLDEADFDSQTPISSFGDKKRPQYGHVLHRIPKAMKVGEQTKCVVRVAFTEEQIIQRIQLDEHVSLDEIRVSDVMQVELLDTNSHSPFTIRSISSKEQLVDRDAFTEWVFYVQPHMAGEFPLTLKVAVVEMVRGKERLREVVLEETVVISTDLDEDDLAEGEFTNTGTGFSFGENADMEAPIDAPKRPTSPSNRKWQRPVALALAALLFVNAGLYAYNPVSYEYQAIKLLNDTPEAYEKLIEKYDESPQPRKQKFVEKALIRKVETIPSEDTIRKVEALDEYVNYVEQKKEVLPPRPQRSVDIAEFKWKAAEITKAPERFESYHNEFKNADVPEIKDRAVDALVNYARVKNTPSAYLKLVQSYPQVQEVKEEVKQKKEEWRKEENSINQSEQKALELLEQEIAIISIGNNLQGNSVATQSQRDVSQLLSENDTNSDVNQEEKTSSTSKEIKQVAVNEKSVKTENGGDSSGNLEKEKNQSKVPSGPNLIKPKVDSPIIAVAENNPEPGLTNKGEIPEERVKATPEELPNMVYIQGGTFEMGDQFGDGEDDEDLHTVTVSDYYLGRHEVTFAEYAEYCAAKDISLPDDESWGKGERPVINVSWYDAIEYCNWRSEQENLTPVYRISGSDVTANWDANGYRLPTEAEWEYAARSRGKYEKWSGTSSVNELSDYANYDSSGDDYDQTAPVGKFKPNALGLYDMSGNVWEWCWDWYDSDYYSTSAGATDPREPDEGSYRVYRGGGWDDDAWLCRAAYRGLDYPDYRDYGIGFRLALSSAR